MTVANHLTDAQLADHVEAALERGDWSEALDTLAHLRVRGARRLGVTTLAHTSRGEHLVTVRPAYADALADAIREVNQPR